MVRTKRFYDVYFPSVDFNEISDYYFRLLDVERDLNAGIIRENKIRSLNDTTALKICLMEGKWNLFKSLIKPFIMGDEVKYLVDPFSCGMYEYINSLYNSYSEAYHKEMQIAKRENRDIMTLDEIALSLVIIPDYEKKEIFDLMFNYDRRLVERIMIKDVLARQISGWGHPVDTERDVVYYSELSNLYPSLELFRKNIRTVYNDTQGCYDDGEMTAKSEIRIDYTHLSADNRLVADNLIRNNKAFLVDEGAYQGLSIVVEGSREDDILTFNDRMFSLINGFNKQDVLYEMVAPLEVYNLVLRYEELLNDGERALLHGKELKLSDLVLIANGLGFGYVYADSVIWRNISSYRRHNEYQQQIVQKKLTIQ